MLVRVHDADEKYRTRPLARKKTESQRRVRGSISRIRWLTEAARGNRTSSVEPSEIARKPNRTSVRLLKTDRKRKREGGILHSAAYLPPPRRAHRLRVALERLSARRIRRERGRGFVIQRGVLEPAQVRGGGGAAVHELGERGARALAADAASLGVRRHFARARGVCVERRTLQQRVQPLLAIVVRGAVVGQGQVARRAVGEE